MPTATPPARYDLPWKAAITHAFRDFMAFFFAEFGVQIDWSKRPHFRDKELAGISLGDAADVMVADKLVEVRLADGRDRTVLIHLEVQAQRDPQLVQRVLDYNYRICKQYRKAVASLVVLADDDPHWRPHSYHHNLMGMVTDTSFATAKLLDYGADTDALMASHNPFAWITLAHLLTQQAHHDAEKLYAAKWQLTKLLFQHGWSSKRIIVLFNVINWMMALPDSYQKRYWRAVLHLEEERKMELFNSLEQSFIDKGWQKGLKKGLKEGLEKGLERGRHEGREEGLAQGREQGRMEGAAALLERQLTRRFGPLPQSVRSKLAKAGPAQIAAWSDALPEAPSLRHVFA
jgi:hypothetical protein